MKIQIKIINSNELHDIRSKVLRNGLDPKMCTFEGDTRINSIHVGAFIENKIVGGVSLIKNNCKINNERDVFNCEVFVFMISIKIWYWHKNYK